VSDGNSGRQSARLKKEKRRRTSRGVRVVGVLVVLGLVAAAAVYHLGWRRIRVVDAVFQPSVALEPTQRVTLQGQSDGVQGEALTADGQTLVTGSADHSVKLWDASTGKERVALAGHVARIMSVALTPDGRTLASGSAMGTDAKGKVVKGAEIKLWDVAASKERASLVSQTGGVQALALR
jgi:WD40 repeat protein